MSCSTWNEKITAPTAKAAADQVETYCQERKSRPDTRCRWLNEVNKHYTASNLTPLDCDGDGEPDMVCLNE